MYVHKLPHLVFPRPPPPTGDLMHELSNDGARAQFDKLIHRVLLPVMVDCAKVGGAVGGTVGRTDVRTHSQ